MEIEMIKAQLEQVIYFLSFPELSLLCLSSYSLFFSSSTFFHCSQVVFW